MFFYNYRAIKFNIVKTMRMEVKGHKLNHMLALKKNVKLYMVKKDLTHL